MKATGYLRVSTEEQARGGVSIDMQRERVTAWAAAHGYDLAAIHIDAGYSGGDPDRPGLALAMADTIASKGVLVFYSLSRWSRNLIHILDMAKQLERGGAAFASVTESLNTSTPTGRVVFHVLAVLAEFEREQLAERIADCIDHKRQQGHRWNCNAPYGYHWIDTGLRSPNGKPILKASILKAEQDILHRAKALAANGATHSHIANALAAAGILTRKGTKPAARWVKKILTKGAEND